MSKGFAASTIKYVRSFATGSITTRHTTSILKSPQRDHDGTASLPVLRRFLLRRTGIKNKPSMGQWVAACFRSAFCAIAIILPECMVLESG